MYSLRVTGQFKKDVKRCAKSGYPLEEMWSVIRLLLNVGYLPEQYQPHRLQGGYVGCWECHIKPDWLLVWKQDDEELVILMTNTGTHSDLF